MLVHGMPGELLAWWAKQMLDLAPAGLRLAGTVSSDALVVALPAPQSGDPALCEAEFLLRHRGRELPVGRFALNAAGLRAAAEAMNGRRRPSCTVLRPPTSLLLERGVTLPLAALHDPGGVLRYEMDRLTPFAAEEVFWAWRIEGQNPAGGALRLRISILPKAELAAPIEALRRGGFAPTRLEPLGPDGRPRDIGLGEPGGTTRSRQDRWRRGGLTVAWVTCAGLAATAVALPFLQQSMALTAAEHRIEALRPHVTEAEAIRKRIAEVNSSQDVIATEQARLGNALQVIAALTEILPDDTHLAELTLRQRSLAMTGRSAAAARLIGLLSADPMIRNAAFAAPVTRALSGQVDVFAIRAEIGM